MRNLFAKCLSALLIACLLLSPAAVMEEEPIQQETEEIEVTEPAETQAAEPIAEEEATKPEGDIEPLQGEESGFDEGITIDSVDEIVGEQEDIELGDLFEDDPQDEVFSLNAPEAQSVEIEAANGVLMAASSNFDVLSNNTTFTVQGKTISASQVGNQYNCWTYASQMYQKIWGQSFSSDFTGSASAGWNSLRQLSDADRTLTADHLKAYVGNAQLGATIRICGCTSGCSAWGNDGLSCGHKGHNVIIVQKDANGFTTVENAYPAGKSSYEVCTRYYSWQGFVNWWGPYGCAYIKYIKWPNAAAYASDTTKPTISNVKVTNVSSAGYTVTCTVTDNVGVTEVKFPTWMDPNAQDDLIWHVGTLIGNTASCTIKTSDHRNKTGCIYITHIYAYDAAGNFSTGGVSCDVPALDTTKPTISNVKVSNLTSSGYTLTCTVKDNVVSARLGRPKTALLD